MADLPQLVINVNLHALQPGFLNSELHYIIASGSNHFRFVPWDEEPAPGEEKFYCFLVEEPLNIPAGNVEVKESYQLVREPFYPIITNGVDVVQMIESMGAKGASKGIRHFHDDVLPDIQHALQEKYGPVHQHVVKSNEWQHYLLVMDHLEISIAATMVYIKQKLKITEDHYAHLQEDESASKKINLTDRHKPEYPR